MSQYPSSEGVIFPNDNKTQDNHPDYRGHVEITGDQIRQLIVMSKAGLKVQLQLAVWERQAKSGVFYKFIKAEAYIKEQQNEFPQQPQQGYQQQGQQQGQQQAPQQGYQQPVQPQYQQPVQQPVQQQPAPPQYQTQPQPEQPEQSPSASPADLGDFDDDIPF